MLCDSLVVMVTQYKIDILTFPLPLAFLSLFCNTVNILNKIRLWQHYLLCVVESILNSTLGKKKDNSNQFENMLYQSLFI